MIYLHTGGGSAVASSIAGSLGKLGFPSVMERFPLWRIALLLV